MGRRGGGDVASFTSILQINTHISRRKTLTKTPKCIIIQGKYGKNPCGVYFALMNGVLLMFETFKKILVDELQIDASAITMEAELSGDLGINSIELANLVMICEDKFDVTIDDDDIHKFITVGDVVEFLESL